MGSRVLRALEEADSFDRQRNFGIQNERRAPPRSDRRRRESRALRPRRCCLRRCSRRERSGVAPSAANAVAARRRRQRAPATRRGSRSHTIDLTCRLHSALPGSPPANAGEWTAPASHGRRTKLLGPNEGPGGKLARSCELRVGCEPVAVAPPPRVSNLSPAPPATGRRRRSHHRLGRHPHAQRTAQALLLTRPPPSMHLFPDRNSAADATANHQTRER